MKKKKSRRTHLHKQQETGDSYRARQIALQQIGFSSYEEYLQSDLWKKIRARVHRPNSYPTDAGADPKHSQSNSCRPSNLAHPQLHAALIVLTRLQTEITRLGLSGGSYPIERYREIHQLQSLLPTVKYALERLTK